MQTAVINTIFTKAKHGRIAFLSDGSKKKEMDCSDRVEHVTSGGPDLYDLPDKDSFFKSL